MKKHSPLLFARHLFFFTALLLCLGTPLSAGNPYSAYYSSDTDKILWFIHASDVHMGTSGSTDSANLGWLVGQARSAINPSFIVVSGDLTDSTNGNIFGYPNGPYQAEWDQYKSILSSNGVDATFFFDIPGNHDAYNDRYFAYYLANSVQGRATGRTQASWVRSFPWGKYHFLGVNTADNTGAAFSIISPYGDHAGLDTTELSFISTELNSNTDAVLTLVFGHHPMVPTGDSSDTYLYYGKDEFVSLMNTKGASLYGYGHTHESSQAYYAQGMTSGIFYFNVAALGKNSPNQFTVTAIDCNAISSATQNINSWPVVLITAPMDRRLGSTINPYAYNVPGSSANPLRALVFDSAAVTQVQYRIDGGSWYGMNNVSTNPRLWQATWDGSNLPEGEHAIEVQAIGSTTKSDSIAVYVQVQTVPDGPSNLAATTISSNQINLAWIDNSSNEAGFKIERCQGIGCSVFTLRATVGANVTAYSDTGLSSGTSYSYRLVAYNGAGSSAYSKTASATTQSTSQTPAAPSSLTAKAVSKSQINLTWRDNSTNEEGFYLERCTGSKCTNFAQIAALGSNSTTYQNAGLTVGTTYRYRICSYNAAGKSAYTSIVSAQTPKR